jgi:hypothetical protein
VAGSLKAKANALEISRAFAFQPNKIVTAICLSNSKLRQPITSHATHKICPKI